MNLLFDFSIATLVGCSYRADDDDDDDDDDYHPQLEKISKLLIWPLYEWTNDVSY